MQSIILLPLTQSTIAANRKILLYIVDTSSYFIQIDHGEIEMAEIELKFQNKHFAIIYLNLPEKRNPLVGWAIS